MRITRALLPAAAVALALAAPAAGGRHGLTVHGWAVPTHTVTQPAAPRIVLPLRLLPVVLGYSWPQPAVGITTQVPLTIAELPVLTSYHWAQPGSTGPRTESAEPWSL